MLPVLLCTLSACTDRTVPAPAKAKQALDAGTIDAAVEDAIVMFDGWHVGDWELDYEKLPALEEKPIEPLNCPEGTSEVGLTEDDGRQAWCDRPDGVKHGPAIRYWENGNRKASRTFKDGKLEGPSFGWDVEGRPDEIGQYVNGLQTGRWLNLLQGKKHMIGWWKAGKQHGPFQQFAANGVRQAVGMFANGEPCGEYKCLDWETEKPTGCVPLKDKCPLTPTGAMCPPCPAGLRFVKKPQ